MLKFYENEYGFFIEVEGLRIYLTNEFKYCTLTCTLVRGRNKRVFPHTAKWTCTSGRGKGSVHSGFYQDTNHYLKKSVVTPYWLSAEMHGLLFSFREMKVGKFSSTSPVRLHVQKWKHIYMDFLIPGIAACYVEFTSTSIFRSELS